MWEERYEGGGVEVRAERSRAPHSHPHAVSADVVQLLVNAREARPTRHTSKSIACTQTLSSPGARCDHTSVLSEGGDIFTVQ